MPTIDSSLVPTISAGQLFTRFTTDDTLNIRWIAPLEPVYYEVANRPVVDTVIRQLVLAKSIDQINLRLSHQSLFPFLVQAQVTSGSNEVNIPLSWIWDMHVSLPAKWENLRLAKIKRISGVSATGAHTGKLRLIFTGTEQNALLETAVFMADYQIDSLLEYQIVRISVPDSTEEATVVSTSETGTINGFIIFRTLDQTETTTSDFYNLVAPPLTTTDSDSDGLFDSPAVYQIVDSAAGGTNPTDDFSLTAVSHGTGLLVASATNHIPDIGSDVNTWLLSFNYPFSTDSTGTSISHTGITIPAGLFKEFSILAPAGDEPTGDTSGNYFPVYISRIAYTSSVPDTIVVYFSTYNTESPSIAPIEFASLTLERGYTAGTILPIIPIENLWPTQAGDTGWSQEFGRGHVVLSDKWSGTGTVVTEFFDDIAALTDEPADILFNAGATRISSFGVNRISKYTPTAGEYDALRGTLVGTTPPSATNRFVVEADEGLGTQVDFSINTSLPADKRVNADIERYGYAATKVHKLVYLVVDTSGSAHDYENDVLPRLTILLGRAPIFGDEWYTGTRFVKFNGHDWIG